jgi:hypothetical protein
MTDHFAYLYNDDEQEFFQKIACDIADEGTPSAATPMVKTASSPEVMTFEKVASRFDQDMFIIKTAGPSGFNLGAIRRGMAHFDFTVENVDMEDDQVVEMFDKIAAETIQHDLEVCRQALYKLGGEEYKEWVDAEIAAAGLELVKAASMDKEALIGLMRAARGIKGALKATKGLGFATRAKAVARAPGQAWKGWRAERAVAKSGKAAKRLAKAEGKLEGLRAREVARIEKAHAIKDPAIRAGVTKDVGESAAAKLQKARANVEKHQAKMQKATGRAEAATARAEGRPVPQTQPSSPQQALDQKTSRTQTQTELERKRGATEAEKATKTPETKPAPADKAELAAAEGAEGVTLKGSYTKMRDQGWGALSGAEKQKLINAGLAGVVGHRVLTGHGVLTGGEGIV